MVLCLSGMRGSGGVFVRWKTLVEASLPRGLLLGVSGFLVTALADDPLFYSEGQSSCGLC